MNKRNNNNTYFVFVGVISFFLLSGLYLVSDFIFKNSHFGIFNNILGNSVTEPEAIKAVNLNTDLFAEEEFKELRLSEGYKFDVNRLVIEKRNPFIVRVSNAGKEQKK